MRQRRGNIEAKNEVKIEVKMGGESDPPAKLEPLFGNTSSTDPRC